MSDLETRLHSLRAMGLVEAFEKIADSDTGKGVKIAKTPAVDAMVALRVITYARGKAHMTSYGWSVSTRIAALKGARKIAAAGPGHWRSR